MLTSVLRKHALSSFRSVRSLTSIDPNLPTSVFTWGYGTQGELGYALPSGREHHTAPRRIPKSMKFKRVNVGECSTSFITAEGEFYCSGLYFNQNFLVPTKVELPFAVKKVYVQKTFAIALDVAGTLWGWGANPGMFLMKRDVLRPFGGESLEPQPLDFDGEITDVEVGQCHFLFTDSKNKLYSAGFPEHGRLGHKASNTSGIVPIPDTIENFAIGDDHNVVQAGGKVYTWGRNDAGQIGDREMLLDIYSILDVPLPLQEITGGTTAVAASRSRSAAIVNNKLYAWGTSFNAHPTEITGIPNNVKLTKVALGGEGGKFCLACLDHEGNIWTAGKSNAMLGRTGDHITASKLVIPGAKRVLDVSGGLGRHMAAIVEMITD